MTTNILDSYADLAEMLATARAAGFRDGIEAACSSLPCEISDKCRCPSMATAPCESCAAYHRIMRSLFTPPAPREPSPSQQTGGGERQALIDLVPFLTKLEDGACESTPYESCCRSCERLGARALEIALDGLSPYPGKDRWSEPSPAPQPTPTPQTTQDEET